MTKWLYGHSKYGIQIDGGDWVNGTFKQCLDVAKKYHDKPWILENPNHTIICQFDPLGIEGL